MTPESFEGIAAKVAQYGSIGQLILTIPAHASFIMSTNFPFRVTCNTLLLLLLLKIYFFITTPLQSSYLYLISWVQDAFLFVVTYFLFVACTGFNRPLSYIGLLFFYIFFLPICVLSIVYTFFLLDLYHFPMNIFSISADNFSFFITYFTNFWLVAGFLLGLGALFTVSYFFPKKQVYQEWSKRIGIILVVMFIPSIFKPFINPILHSVSEEILLSLRADANIKKLQPPVASITQAGKFSHLNQSFDTLPDARFKYNRIVVLVMEGLKYNDFMQKSLADSSSFLNRHKQHIKQYSNYHTLNIDSYTSLMAMMNSIFVPYQSHLSKEKFAFSDNCNNLVRFFNKNNYATFFITSYGRQQATFVPDVNEWSTSFYLDSLESITRFTCLTTTPIEKACEDNAVLDALTDTVAKYPQIFALQEMVYGHMTEWLKLVGTDPVTYYNRYFNNFVDNLHQKGIADSTLIFILSDHGPKENALDLENYHIPFMVYATNITDTTSNQVFTSHLNFKDIVLQTATNLPVTITPQPIYILGNSIELVYGTITPTGKYALITNRRQYAQSNLTKQQVLKLNKDFQNYLNYYESLRLHCNR
ncbi:DUF229 domain-containing protein [Sphingobacteriales bacterium UPWRP_1]|nr:hypothetical protein B6N25_07450 [Sphingobacteriales bacterium TSM_CSS]PSJ78727.1 DUF229 domain-containing protein [Sphingobacteriales bacterium UPWRP_1]